MHRATCAECGKPCEVPFKPSGDKPVFCSNCFGKGNGGPSPSKPDQSGRKFDEMNAKLDQILSILKHSSSASKESVKEQPVKEVSGIKLKKLGMATVKATTVTQAAPAALKKEAKKVAPKKEATPTKPAKKASKKKAK
jgi:CxxC-x17-CxxC domain-containing protein